MSCGEREWLLQCAAKLNPHGGSALDIHHLLDSLGIPVEVRSDSQPRRIGEARKLQDGSYRILLFRAADVQPNERRERFTLAHELGHVLLDRRFGRSPASDGEYWEQEDWCNAFAGCLLVPDAAMEDVDPSCPANVLKHMWQFSSTFRVSPQVAAHRCSEVHPGLALISAEWIQNAACARVARVQWCVSSDPEVTFGKGRHLGSTDPLGRAMLEGNPRFHLTSPKNRWGALGKAGPRVTVCIARSREETGL